MGNVVGIDLGTTNSVAAFKLAEVEVVTADDNTPPERKLTRSVVGATSLGLGGDDCGQQVVGQEAYNQLKHDPENAIVSIKRLMGRGFSDPVVQEHHSRYLYKVTKSTQGTDNSISVWLGGKEYQPEDISAAIIKKVVENAQNFQIQRGQKSTITQAVITIPAYFNDKQRHATQTAATRAGLALPELLPEPTAAAISYGFKPDADDVKTILVFDFGGGTFDSSIITTSGNQFIESGKAGDLWLGGDDLDNRIIDFVKEQVAIEEGLENIDRAIAKMPYYQRVRFEGDLKLAVEQAKIQLSSAPVAHILPSTPLLDEFGATVYVDVELRREEFEQMISPLVDRAIAICQDAIKYSEYPEEMVDVFLLVGGSSQIPLVQRKMRETFGAHKVVVHPRPLYAVAEGAAIVAAGLTEKVETVSRDYCIELVDEPRYKLIERGAILPVKQLRTFRTEANGQRLIHFKFFSPDRVKEVLDLVAHDELIGEMWLPLDRYYPQGTEVLVTLELDERMGYLQATATLKNDPSIRVSCLFSRGGLDEKICKQVEEIIQNLNQAGNLTDKGVAEANRLASEVIVAANQILGLDGKVQPEQLKLAEEKLRKLQAFASEDYDLAEFFASEFEFINSRCDFLLPHAQKTRLQNSAQQLRDAIATDNLVAMQKLSANAKTETDNLPEQVRTILFCKDAIARVQITDPNQARVMAGKLEEILAYLEQDNSYEAEKLLRELLPTLRPYLAQELPTVNISTGLTR
ncbi:MAG: Hsp70 family protein [Oscillatoria sp. PMC 1051.18]|nr:Hsp70 family protein [Oscillatoria sp. PMC 1050.18]MEC5028678.1 Hsp70 family protein [Oscillatoria sp. PMC 1051.18]